MDEVQARRLLKTGQWRGENAVVCLECGRSFTALGKHLPAHGMDAATYRERWGMAVHQSLASREYGQRRAVIAVEHGGGERLAPWRGRPGEATFSRLVRQDRRPDAEAARERANLAWRTEQHAAVLDRATRVAVEAGHADLASCITAWSWTDGLSQAQIAERLGMGRSTLTRVIRELGLRSRPRGPMPGR